jgi:hypothetical protein
LQLPQSYTIASTSTASGPSTTAATTSGFPNTSNYNNNNISHEHVNILPSTSQQQQQNNLIRLPHHLQHHHLQQQPNSSIGGNEGLQNQQNFGGFLPSHLLQHPQHPLTMQVPGASNEIQNNVANNSAPPDLASIQQYVMLMNQQQQQQQQQHAAAIALQNQQQQQNAGQNSLAANALLFNALNRSNDPNFAALSALQSPSVDLSQAAFVLNNERRPSTHFLPPPSAPPTGQGPSSHPQLTPVHQTPPMLSPLLQAAVQQQQHHQQQLQQQHHHQSISQQSLEELAALSQLNPNLIQANLLSELQREVQRQQQAAAAAAAAHQQAQQFQHLQAALQQANVPPGHAQQLLSVLQQQHQQQQQQQQQHQQHQQQQQQQQLLAQQSLASGLFTPGGGMRPQMKPPMAPPQASPLLKQATTINSSPINGMRFMDEPSTSAKKMSQPQLPSIPMQGGGGASSSLPKRASFSSQPSTAQASTSSRKTSAAAIQNLPKPIPTPISKAPPPLSLPSTSSISSSSQQLQPGPSTYLSQQQQQQQLQTPPGLPQQPYYPTHFLRGTSIRLENGETRLIEDMKAEDFYKSSQLTSEMRVCIGEISEIKQTQCCRFVNLSYKMDIDGQPAIGTMTASAEYPFHEIDSGWTSYDPIKTLNLYGLKCKKLEIGDKCVLLSKDFVDKDDSELKKKWQKQFKGQFKGYAKSQSLAEKEDIKDQPMEIQRSSNHGNHGQNRLVRKSIPPPLAMNSTTGFPFIHQSNGPTTSHHSSTSESITPLTSTISAPADTYISNHSFSLSLPSNEPFSAPAAMDDLTVDAQMAHEAYVKQQQQQHQSDMMDSGGSEAMQIDEEDPSPASSSSTLKQQPSTSQQQSQPHQHQQQRQQLPPQDDVFLDFSI